MDYRHQKDTHGLFSLDLQHPGHYERYLYFGAWGQQPLQGVHAVVSDESLDTKGEEQRTSGSWRYVETIL